MRRKLRKTTNEPIKKNDIKTIELNEWKDESDENGERELEKKTYVHKIDVGCVYCNWVTCFDFMQCSANLHVCLRPYILFIAVRVE